MTTSVTTPQEPSTTIPRAAAVRLALLYACIFGIIGVYMPFWPAWLAARGMDGSEIGVLMAVGPWLAVLVSPAAGLLSDVIQRHRPILLAAAVLYAGAFAVVAAADSFWPIFICMCLAGAANAPFIPLVDNLTLLAQQKGLIDYGKVRLWGSLAFIASSLLVGRILSSAPEHVILWVIWLGAGAMVMAAYFTPEYVPTRASRRGPSAMVALRVLVRDRSFVLFLSVAVALLASHGVLYAVGTLHWRNSGIDVGVIGLLWAEGVVAEILLFAYGRRLLEAMSPTKLLAMAALAGLVRWLGLALSTDIAWLIALQTLHGLTFGAAHLGGMIFISRAVPPSLTGTAQGLYNALVWGLGLGTMMALAGVLYESVQGGAYWAMVGSSGVGLVAVVLLSRRWDGGRLHIDDSFPPPEAR